MLYKVDDNNAFKSSNLQNWYYNSDFWLQGKMRHLKDVHDFTGQLVADLIREQQLDHKPKVLDLGCGEGWLYRLIKEIGIEMDYVGIDFNEIFIVNNSKTYKNGDARFILNDLEDEPPELLLDFADIAINFFNFFEIPDIERAFENTAKMLADNSILIIVNIDPIMQILSVSENFDDFIASLKQYEIYQTRLGYDKDIDVGDERSGRIYKSLLYSTATYVELAKRNGLQLSDYKEIIKTANFVPQIYQFIIFKK